jgi:S-DNA-T family DNA segregation ATPase FtsK/SpoIIIE
MIRTILTAVIILLLPLTSAAKISHRGEGCWRTIPKKHRALTRALLSGEKKDDVIRVNFPARITFHTSNEHESRIIIGQSGAEKLCVAGDALIKLDNTIQRVQCAYMDTHEIGGIAQFISEQEGYREAYPLPESPSEEENNELINVDLSNLDPKFEEAAALIVSTQQGSTSMIRRKLSINYNRAGRMMDQLEVAGVVGPQIGSNPREVKITDLNQLDRLIKQLKSL